MKTFYPLAPPFHRFFINVFYLSINFTLLQFSIRGELGSYLILFLSAGNLIVFFAGTYLSFFQVPMVMMVFPILYLATVSFLPDSPPSLMARNKPDEAWDSLLFYRTVGSHKIVTENFKEEFENLKKSLQNQGYDQWEWKDFCEF